MLTETNAYQFYKNWDKLETYHPRAGAVRTLTENGVYKTGTSFYDESGLFLPSAHYEALFEGI